MGIKKRFQLLCGRHEMGKGENKVKYRARNRRTRELFEGFSDEIETEKDLVDLFGPQKFKLLPSYEPLGEGNDNFDRMKVAELRELAEEEEIDLGEATKKGEIISLIRSATCEV